MLNVVIDWDIIDPSTREVITKAIKKHCEDRGIAYRDEWSFTHLHDIGITFGVTVDFKD